MLKIINILFFFLLQDFLTECRRQVTGKGMRMMVVGTAAITYLWLSREQAYRCFFRLVHALIHMHSALLHMRA